LPLIGGKLASLAAVTVDGPEFIITRLAGDKSNPPAVRGKGRFKGSTGPLMADLHVVAIDQIVVEDLRAVGIALDKELELAIGRDRFPFGGLQVGPRAR